MAGVKKLITRGDTRVDACVWKKLLQEELWRPVRGITGLITVLAVIVSG